MGSQVVGSVEISETSMASILIKFNSRIGSVNFGEHSNYILPLDLNIFHGGIPQYTHFPSPKESEYS